jgi:hypothetical protein
MVSNATLYKLSAVFGVTALIVVLDWFYLLYITSYGLEQKVQQVTLGGFMFSLPLLWVPVAGIVLVSLVAWYEISTQLFPRRPSIEADSLAKLRLLRAIAFSVALFAIVLYVPYLVGSNWFWTRLSGAGKSFTQIRDFGFSLLGTAESLMAFSTLWQYSLSQNLATAVMVVAAWAFGRAARRPRKQR